MPTSVPMYHTTTENAIQQRTGGFMEIIHHPYGTGVYVEGEIFGWVCNTLNDKYSAWSVEQTKDRKLFDNEEDGVQYLSQQVQKGV